MDLAQSRSNRSSLGFNFPYPHHGPVKDSLCEIDWKYREISVWGGRNIFSVSTISCLVGLVGWLVVLRMNVDLAISSHISTWKQWRGRESNPGPLAPQAKSLTTRPPLLPVPCRKKKSNHPISSNSHQSEIPFFYNLMCTYVVVSFKICAHE